jgi:hypothetical protein
LKDGFWRSLLWFYGPVILIIFMAFVNLFLQFLDPAWPIPFLLLRGFGIASDIACR